MWKFNIIASPRHLAVSEKARNYPALFRPMRIFANGRSSTLPTMLRRETEEKEYPIDSSLNSTTYGIVGVTFFLQRPSIQKTHSKLTYKGSKYLTRAFIFI